jgi:hypothetical protein
MARIAFRILTPGGAPAVGAFTPWSHHDFSRFAIVLPPAALGLFIDVA